MSEYHKIQTIYKRDPENNYKTLLEGEYSLPVFEYLADNNWVATEKVDGTNIRVNYNLGAYGEVSFAGRTDRADIPPFLADALEELFPARNLIDVFGEEGPRVTLYGEGYGPKIQGGGKYTQDHSFVLFDVLIDGMFLERHNVEGIGEKLGISVVPIIAEGTLHSLVELARKGIRSEWGDFQAEGVVARPEVEMRTRRGHRVITKIKCKDFV